MLLEDPANPGGRQLVASRAGIRRFWPEGTGPDGTDAGDFLQDWRGRLQARRDPSAAPACIIYAAYEAGGMFERLPAPATPVPAAILWMLYPEWSLCFEGDAVHLAAGSESMLDELERMLAHAAANPAPEGDASVAGDARGDAWDGAWEVTPGEDYMDAVRRVKAYVAAGDVFQANIARFWRMPFAAEALPALHARLRRVNPAPFSGWLRVETDETTMHVLSASPERLFRLMPDGMVETRPIAGTRRRGQADDEAMRRELLLSEKERAEHIMLVDLERNDLGRVCRPGTVEVNERMVVERYATVQHIVSNVRGRLRPECDVVDVFRAMFPGGTITGCPKVRCMEIIHELERRARGPYTGAMGYVAWDGSADMNILIRSFWHVDGALHWAAGAGIVADSDPSRELAETEHKAAGLLRALTP